MHTAERPLAVLFDLDGTLIDSIELILRSARHAFRDWPRHRPTDAEWLTGVGIPLPTMLRRYAETEEELQQLITGYREYQMAHHDRLVRCYDGVPEVLASLKEDGHPIAIVTSKSDALALRGLEQAGIAHHMTTIVGCDSCTRHKPDAEPVLVALERLGYPPGEAIFIGDSVHDIESGNAAGVVSVAALWGPFQREELEASRPRHFLSSIDALPQLIQQIAAA